MKKAEEEAAKISGVVEKKMSELGVKLNETNRAANDVVKRNEREGNKMDEIKVRKINAERGTGGGSEEPILCSLEAMLRGSQSPKCGSCSQWSNGGQERKELRKRM